MESKDINWLVMSYLTSRLIPIMLQLDSRTKKSTKTILVKQANMNELETVEPYSSSVRL